MILNNAVILIFHVTLVPHQPLAISMPFKPEVKITLALSENRSIVRSLERGIKAN